MWALLGMGVGRVSHVQGGMAATLRALETQLYSSAKHRYAAHPNSHISRDSEGAIVQASVYVTPCWTKSD